MIKVKNKLVSVIIPVYNRQKMCLSAIDSALNQTYQNIEIIVGDNCSTDNTYSVLYERYSANSKVVLFRNSENLGPVKNWIECLKRCEGEYVKILWSDDLIDPMCIEKMTDMLEAHSDAGFVYSAVKIFSSNDTDCDSLIEQAKSVEGTTYVIGKSGYYDAGKFLDDVYSLYFSKTPVSPGCAMFRRDALTIRENIPNLLGYEHKKTGAGTDLLVYLDSFEKYPGFVFIDEPLCFFREHKQSISCYDSSINMGYLTAKIQYFIENKYKQYQTNLNIDILRTYKKDHAEKGTQYVSIKHNYSILLKYYSAEKKYAGIYGSYFLLKIVVYKVGGILINLIRSIRRQFV